MAFRDARGEITDILAKIPVDAITLIHSRKGAVRANHFHAKTTQYAYVLSGKIRYLSQMPGGAVRRRLLKTGDLVLSLPGERHTFVAMQDSVFLSLSFGPRRGTDYEKDTYRLRPPLA